MGILQNIRTRSVGVLSERVYNIVTKFKSLMCTTHKSGKRKCMFIMVIPLILFITIKNVSVVFDIRVEYKLKWSKKTDMTYVQSIHCKCPKDYVFDCLIPK